MKNNFQVEYNDGDECIAIWTNYVPTIGDTVTFPNVCDMDDFLHKDIEKKVLSVKHILEPCPDMDGLPSSDYCEKFIVELELIQKIILPYPYNSNEQLKNL